MEKPHSILRGPIISRERERDERERERERETTQREIEKERETHPGARPNACLAFMFAQRFGVAELLQRRRIVTSSQRVPIASAMSPVFRQNLEAMLRLWRVGELIGGFWDGFLEGVVDMGVDFLMGVPCFWWTTEAILRGSSLKKALI